MEKRVPSPHRIQWCDPATKEWECRADNMAGWIELPPQYYAATSFIFEKDDKIVAYQNGYCLEMTFVGAPLVWSIRYLTPDKMEVANAA